ncbi:hypothetical protein [Streptomyces sp. NPDC058572]|uniref:hypothetical protein n=1 Tax=Streptomyces sp. NPDC058572 TaxID=3346546 RepID=UPI0036563A45
MARGSRCVPDPGRQHQPKMPPPVDSCCPDCAWAPIVPSLPPHLVQLGFDYGLAVEAGDDTTAARLAPEVEQLPGLLPAIAELAVFPVTALSDDTEPCADSFVLDEVGVIYLMAIREWATHAPAAAAPGIARAIAHFVGQVLADAPARTTVHPVCLHSVGGARGAAGVREWCALSGLGAVEWAGWRRRVSP